MRVAFGENTALDLHCHWAAFQNLRIKYQFSSEYFEEQLSTVNCSYHIVKALRAGATVINASLMSIRTQVGVRRAVFECREPRWALAGVLTCGHAGTYPTFVFQSNKRADL